MIIRKAGLSSQNQGFSLIEVLIAVVVLATGLLALSALQGALAKSSSEAKTRTRVAALLSARMDQLRSTPYDAITSSSDSCATVATDDWIPASLCSEAGLGALSSTQTVQVWSSGVGGASFSQATPANPTFDPQFKRVLLSASWTDAGNQPHTLSISSDLSELALRSSLMPTPDPNGSAGIGPVVRQSTPVTDGVIPIAIGNNSATAASNPRPDFEGAKNNLTLTGTRFDSLTYTPDGTAVRVQRRVETNVIKCSCKYGAAGSGFVNLPAVSRVPQWPAVWTGTQYELYKPGSTGDAPGTSYKSGPNPAVPDDNQSDLCTECCRDHHDDSSAGVAKFDPERIVTLNKAHSHFSANTVGALTIVPNTNASVYVESCRMIRVDGLWRTAADMYAVKINLLETGKGAVLTPTAARTGVPTDDATEAYKRFAVSYLQEYDGTVSTPPAGVDLAFVNASPSLDLPTLVTFQKADTSARYLHDRAMYVDYLEAAAKAQIVDSRGDTIKCATADKTNCVLPYLPFTTINVTEAADWRAINGSVLTVNSGSILSASPQEPSGGRTFAGGAGTTKAEASMGRSNSSLAAAGYADLAVLDTIDNDEGTKAVDAQDFKVDDGTSSGDKFKVIYTGLATQSNVQTDYSIGSDARTCVRISGDPVTTRRCETNTTPLGAGNLTFGNYGISGITTPVSITCTDTDNQGNARSVTELFPVPAFENWSVSKAEVCSASGTCSASGISLLSSPAQPVDDGRMREITTYSINALPKGVAATSDYVKATFVKTATISLGQSDVQSCSNQNGNSIKSVVWKTPYPWN